ncbi:putative peptide transporter PTR2 [Halenospora varia]|nr:putative peptide transporter PTR2 [Halenospora varia]
MRDVVLEDTLTSAPAPVVAGLEEGNHVTLTPVHDNMDSHGQIIPTEEELAVLPRIAGTMPWSAYMLCAVEFAERASYYGCNQVFKNFIRAPLPLNGNGAGAPPRTGEGHQKSAGALGKGTVVASAMTDAFKFLAYALPIFGGWLADAHLGRFKTIVIGVIICGISHVIMIISAIPSVIQAGKAIGPFALSLYMLSIGAALFKPNIAPAILDQNPHLKPHVVTKSNGAKVIVDPEATAESIMLWFYLLVNVGGFMGVATSYLAKYVGFWSSYLLPGIIYFLLPVFLILVNKRLKKLPPGGSALGDFIKVNIMALKAAGIRGIGRKGYFNRVKPSVIAASGDPRTFHWDDRFIDDVSRTMDACAIFLFFPIQQINDGALGAAANAQSASLTSNGVPNDLLDNLNPLAIIVLIPIMNHGIYPLLRKLGIRFGPIKRMTFGFFIAAIGASSYAVIQHYIYQTSPCGYKASTCVEGTPGFDGEGVSHLSLWLYAIPTAVTATSEVFINVTALGMAYSRAPPNMKGLVMALNLFMTSISTAISLATANAIQDPYLVWAFAAPSIIGFVAAFVFYWLFRKLDDEDFFVHADSQLDLTLKNEHVAKDEEKDLKYHSSLDEKNSDSKEVREVKE